MNKKLPKTRRTQRTQTLPDFKVWKAVAHNGHSNTSVGFLVTEAVNADRLVALVFYDDSGNDMIEEEAQDAAMWIAEDPTVMDRAPGPWTDLRDLARPNSIREIPAWVYTLCLEPIEKSEDDERVTLNDIFCPVRFERWRKQHAKQ